MKKILLLLSLLMPAALHAQSYTIDWHKVAGGGGVSSNGANGYSVSGTIGQPDAGGAMSGGGYSVVGGFWSIISVVQTVNSPLLTITHTGSSSVVVSWPSSATGFMLQQTTNLAATNSWTTSGYSITTNGANESITIAPPSGNLFFRLVNP